MRKLIPVFLVLALVGMGQNGATRPATKPATQPAYISLEQVLLRMPVKFKPKQEETPRQKAEREEWVLSQTTGKRIRTTMVVTTIAESQHERFISGENATIRPSFHFNVDFPKLYQQDSVIIEGDLVTANVEPWGVSPYLKNAKVIEVKPARR